MPVDRPFARGADASVDLAIGGPAPAFEIVRREEYPGRQPTPRDARVQLCVGLPAAAASVRIMRVRRVGDSEVEGRPGFQLLRVTAAELKPQRRRIAVLSKHPGGCRTGVEARRIVISEVEDRYRPAFA